MGIFGYWAGLSILFLRNKGEFGTRPYRISVLGIFGYWAGLSILFLRNKGEFGTRPYRISVLKIIFVQE
ncbi:hypothetical protein WN50_32205 [Limnoraphis robusta CS-951]|uniref:Uncharacterized protein n=1 Tax=Limnoraphis robusta CS-951 TaxID=1637645 RepID=A0A0J9EXZ9_9CYAN|nr:hypothetical protein WN50_32205 [Limnoraphis robusta CS-951]